jgi:hypothetical protein
MIEHHPAECECWMTGLSWPGARPLRNRRVPSKTLQPKFAPRARPRRLKLISSTASCPTSAMTMSPVERSNENRNGLRSPYE